MGEKLDPKNAEAAEKLLKNLDPKKYEAAEPFLRVVKGIGGQIVYGGTGSEYGRPAGSLARQSPRSENFSLE